MKPLSRAQAAFFRKAAALLSPSGRNAKLLILTYHRVVETPDAMNPSDPEATEFAAQMDLVGGLFNVLTIRDAVARLDAHSLPTRAVCITFDDGYSNNCTVAAPILAARGMTGTFFVVTEYLDGGRMWNDTVIEAVRRADARLDLGPLGLGAHEFHDEHQRAAAANELLTKLKYVPVAERLRRAEDVASIVGKPLPGSLMMTENEVRSLERLGMEIGAHSISHPILAAIDDRQAQIEISGCKARLESVIGRPVTSFAYPNGRPGTDYTARHVDMVRKAGYRTAVSTAWGCARAGADRLQLPRITPWDRTSARFAARMLQTYLRPAAALA